MTTSLLSRTPAQAERDSSFFATPTLAQVPTICLTTATPSISELQTTPSILAPKAQSDNRKRLVPKKSKLSLLNNNSNNRTDRSTSKDFSDVSRRVGLPPSTGRTFDIYVDPADDPDIGEIVVLKKKKSRAGLNEVQWNALGDVTNTGEAKFNNTKHSNPDAPLKPKREEEKGDKWWTLGRSRHDSKSLKAKLRENDTGKENSKEKESKKSTIRRSRQSTPPEEPTVHVEPRQRSQSFDTGMLLNGPTANFISVPMPNDDESPRRNHVRTITSPSLYGSTPRVPSTLPNQVSQPQPQPQPEKINEEKKRARNGSITLRAIRSVKSLARMSSWAQLKNMSSSEAESDDEEMGTSQKGIKKGAKEDKRERKQETKEKKDRKKKSRSIRGSISGFEALRNHFGSVKMGVNFSGTLRSVSSQSTDTSNSSEGTIRDISRRHSEASTSSAQTSDTSGSDIEPIIGRQSKSSGASSIRWDDRTDTLRDQDRRASGQTKKRNGSKRSPEGRRRPALASIFSTNIENQLDATPRAKRQPILSVHTADLKPESEISATLLDINVVEGDDTPVKKTRPVSEQMLGKERPRGIVGSDDTGALCLLDAVTSDLASLINRLDLEATPTGSPRNSPSLARALDRSLSSIAESSPLKINANTSGSLRTHTRHRTCASESGANFFGEKVVSWPTPDQGEKTPTHQARHKWSRSLSTSPPVPHEVSPVFHPLPAPSRPSSKECLKEPKEDLLSELPSIATSSFTTFGKQSQNSKVKKSSRSSTKVGKRSKGSRGSVMAQLDASDSIFLEESTKRSLGLRGTLGSVGSTSLNYDPNDPNGDIPKELRVLLGEKSPQSPSFREVSERGLLFEAPPVVSPLPPSPGTPPNMELPPVFDDGLSPEEFDDVDDGIFDRLGSVVDENETKKSFDFTEELKGLTASGTADNKSFVMQLEDAFRTPRKFSPLRLSSKFGGREREESIPDVPLVPILYQSDTSQDDISERSVSPGGSIDDCESKDSFMTDSPDVNDENICISLQRSMFDESAGTLDLNFKFGGKSLDATSISDEIGGSRQSLDRSLVSPVQLSRSPSISSLKSSDSRRNMMSMEDFLGSLSQPSRQSFASMNSTSSRPLTLSDVIPPPSHETRRHSYLSVNDEERSILKSIYAKADEVSSRISVVESPIDNVSVSVNRQTALDRLITHSRQQSEISFTGLSSFSEIRRGFEFGSSFSTFYPPAEASGSTSASVSAPDAPGACDTSNASNASNHLQPPVNSRWRDSMYSLASVSSYGYVTRPGVHDPFEFGAPVRPLSDDMSFTVEDTFNFMRPGLQRSRMDSDVSSFSFQVPHQQPQPFAVLHQRRIRKQVESIYSVASGPPVSLYNNRGFGIYNQNRNGNNANAGKTQQNASSDSLASEFSAHRLGRPGVGDKMFESAREHGIPLASISASPSQMESNQDWQSPTGSIMDSDSVIDETGRRSLESDSVFGQDKYHIPPQAPGLLPPGQFRPLSTYSLMSNNSPKRDDDTMISMLGGGYVRRRSIGSAIEASPCMRVEKRRPKGTLGHALARIPSGDAYDFVEESVNGSPDRARSLISQPSFYSIDSAKRTEAISQQISPLSEAGRDQNRPSVYFGDSRMSMARKGLLERLSLEDLCLSGDGEENSQRRSLAIFRRPEPASRVRGTSTSQSYAVNGSDTPPLSASSSRFTDSRGSFDLNRLNAMLSNTSNGDVGADRISSRLRASNHRRRISEARASRTSSIYETIDEEVMYPAESFSFKDDQLKGSVNSSASDLSNVRILQWDNDETGPALRMIYSLQEEARQALDASQRQFADTPFSIDALQSFKPPSNISVWKALLEHSKKTYGPLPQELHGCARTARARTNSRPSPYPRNRVFYAPNELPPNLRTAMFSGKLAPPVSKPLQDKSVNPNIAPSTTFEASKEAITKTFVPFSKTFKKKVSLAALTKDKSSLVSPRSSKRTQVFSSARSKTLLSEKRSTKGKSPRKKKNKENKENIIKGTSRTTENLRISRPRPQGRGRAAPAPRAMRL